MIPDRASNVSGWEFDKLVAILLRQFKRLFAQRGVELTEAEIQHIGKQAANRKLLSGKTQPVLVALRDIIEESVGVLKQWDLTFAKSLSTEMTDISGWESTADFLQIANEKGNAEIRITAGSSLAVILGEPRHAVFLLQAVDHDLKADGQLDVDAIIAKRALLYASRVDVEASDWRDQVAAWVKTAGSADSE